MQDAIIHHLRGDQTVTLHLNPAFYEALKEKARANGVSFNVEVITQLSGNISLPIPFPIRKQITGEDVRKYRRDNLLTQVELAQKLGTHSETISRWENGSPISPIYQRTFNEKCK